MSQFLLSDNTRNLIKIALAEGPGVNNVNYLNAYNAIYNDIKNRPGVDSGTVQWFSQAGLVNTQLFKPNPTGTWIHDYMFAAAASEGVTLTDPIFQQVSNRIGFTVFTQISKNNGFFDTDQFSPRGIAKDDAGSGLGLIDDLFPKAHLDYAIWGGTLFAKGVLNNNSYFDDYSIDTTDPSGRDCLAINAGATAALLGAGSNVVAGAVTGSLSFGAIKDDLGMLSSLDWATMFECAPPPAITGSAGSPDAVQLFSDLLNERNLGAMSFPSGVTNLYDAAGNLVKSLTTDSSGAIESEADFSYGSNYNSITVTYKNGADVVVGRDQLSYVQTTGLLSDTYIALNSSGQQLFTQNGVESSGGNYVFTIAGQGDVVDLSNATVGFAAGANATIDGNGLTVNAASGVTAILNGVGNTLNSSLAGDVFKLGGTGNRVSASGDTILLAQNSSTDIFGNANTITDVGGDFVVAGNGDSVQILGLTSGATVNGGGNTISFGSGAGGSTFTLEGTGTDADTLNLAGATDVTALLGNATASIDLGTGTALTVSGVSGSIEINNQGNLTVQGTNSADGISSSISLNAADGNGSLAIGGQSVFSFGSGSSVTVDAGSITVASAPAAGWEETAQLSQSGALTQTFASTSSGGLSALTFSDDPGDFFDTGPQLTSATLDGQAIDLTRVYTDIQSGAQTGAQGAATQTGSLLAADQSAFQAALTTGDLSALPSDPEGWLTGLSSVLGSASVDASISGSIVSDVNSNAGSIIALIPAASQGDFSLSGYQYDPGLPTVPGDFAGTVIVNDGGDSMTIVGGNLTSVTVEGIDFVYDTLPASGGGGGGDDGGDSGMEEYLGMAQAIFGHSSATAITAAQFLNGVGAWSGDGTPDSPYTFTPLFDYQPAGGVSVPDIPGVNIGSGYGEGDSGNAASGGSGGYGNQNGGIFGGGGDNNDSNPLTIIISDPLVLSTDGGPINLLSEQESEEIYGTQGFGRPTDTGWVGANTGFLATNVSGTITVIQNFTDLAALDANHDGAISASDPAWATLGVYVYANQSGVANGQYGFVSLSELGIQSINVVSTATNQNVNGNWISATATVTFTDGSTEPIDDVSFEGTAKPQIASQGLSGNSGAALGFYSRALEYLPAKAEGTAQQIAQTTGSLASWASSLPGLDSDSTATLSRGSLEDVNDISVVGGDTLVYNEADPTYGTVLNLDDAHIYMLEANGSVQYNSASIYADFNAAANSVAHELTMIDATATAVAGAATAQSNSESAAMAADISNATIGSPQDQGAAADAASTEQSWLTAFTYLASTLNSIPNATQALNTSAADLEQIVLPSGVHYLTADDAQRAAFLLGNQSELTQALAQGTAAFETLLAAVAQAWNVSKLTYAAAGSTVQAAGGDLVLAAAGAETLREGVAPSTYVILPGAQVTITGFHAGKNGSRLDFLSPGETVTFSEVANGTQVQMGATSVILVGVNFSALSYFDNFSGVSAASFATLNGTVINLGSSGSVIEDGTMHIDTLTASGSSNTLIANDGIDVITANGSSNTIIGGSGADMLNAAGSSNTLFAGAGTNELVISGAGSSNVLIGGKGVDDMLANSGQQTHDTLVGASGDDVMRVTGNSNTLIAGSGVDALFANGNSNTLISGSDDDLLEVGSGSGNVLVGGSGASELVGDATGNTLIAGTGETQAFYTADSLTVNLVAGTASVNGSGLADTLVNISAVDVVGTGDTLVAGDSAAILWGSGKGDTLIGGSGATTFVSNMAGNTLEAGSGVAQVRYLYDGIVIDLAAGAVTNVVGGGTRDTLVGITQAVTTGNNDTLIGTSSGKNFLAGKGKADTLIASGTSNTLMGGTASMFVSNAVGSNTLIAGTGVASVGYDASAAAIDLATGAVVQGTASDTLVGTFSVATVDGSNDTLSGGSAATTLVSNAADNTLIAGTGQTQAWYANADVTVNLDAGTAGKNGSSAGDTLIGIKAVNVSGNNDTFVAVTAGHTLVAEGAMDTMVSGAAGNTLIDTAGGAIASYGSGVNVNLGAGTAVLGTSSDILIGVTRVAATGSHETLVGGHGASTLIGDAAGNTLIAQSVLTAADYTENNVTVNLDAGAAGVNGSTAFDTLVGIKIGIVSGSGNTLIGGGGDVLVNVSGDSDTLIATGTGETLEGGSGNATLISSMAGNTLVGGSGATTADFTASNLTINLSKGTVTDGVATGAISGISDVLIKGNDDVVLGGFRDVIEANGNANTLVAALGGGDFLQVLNGIDNTIVAAGSGNTLEGGAGVTTLMSSAAGNTLIGTAGQTVADYSGSNLTVNLQAGTATINGLATSGEDTLIGITAAQVTGLDDTLIGSDGSVLSDVGLGDTLFANGSHDVLKAGSSFSTLGSNAGGNTLIGTLGSTDAFYGGNDVTVNLADGMAEIDGSSTTDTLIGIDIAQAGGTGDTLFGAAGISTLGSNAAGNTLVAGTARTVASYMGANVTVNLGVGTATVKGATSSDVLIDFLAATVSGAYDTLIGNAGGDDFLAATGANDTLVALGNGNTLEGASGSDTLITNSAGNTLVGNGNSTVAYYTGNNLTVNLSSGLVAGVTDLVAAGINDVIIAGSGNVTLSAEGSRDILEGGSGVSTLTGNGNGNTLVGGAGPTVVAYAGSGNTINLAAQRAGGDVLSGITVAEAIGSGQLLIGANSGTSTLIGNALGDTLEGGTSGTVALYSGDNMTATATTVKVNGAAVADTLVNGLIVDMWGNHDTMLDGGIANGNYDTLYGEALRGNYGTIINSGYEASLIGSYDTLIGSGDVSGNDNVAIGMMLSATGSNNVLIGSGDGANLEGDSGVTTLVSTGSYNRLEGGYAGGTVIAQYGSGMYVDLSETQQSEVVAENASLWWSNFNAGGWEPGEAGYGGDSLWGIKAVQVSGSENILIAGNGGDTLGGDGDNNTLIAANGWARNSVIDLWTDSLYTSGNGTYVVSEITGKEDTLEGSFDTFMASGNYDVVNMGGKVELATGSHDFLSGAETLLAQGSNDTLLDAATAIATGWNDTLINSTLMEAGAGTSILIGWADGSTLVGGSAGVAIATYGDVTNYYGVTNPSSNETFLSSGLVVDLGSGTVSGGSIGWSEYDWVNNERVLNHSVVANTGVDTLIGIDVAQATGTGETLIGNAGVSTLVSSGNGNTLVAGSAQTVLYFALNGAYVTLGDGQNGLASVTPAADLTSHFPVKVPGATQDALVGIRTVDVVGNEGYVVGSSLGRDLLEAEGTGNTLIAQGTRNTLLASGGSETLSGSGDDLIKITGGTGLNVLKSGGGSVLEDLGGSGVYDTLIAAHDDTLVDMTGSALLETNLKNNTLIGTGRTKAYFSWLATATPAHVVVDLGTGIATDGHDDTDTLIGINSAMVAAGTSATLIGANGGGSFLQGVGSGTTMIAAGSENTLQGGQLATLVSSSIGGNTLIGGIRLNAASAGVAFYSESFMTIDLATGIASGYGRMNDTLIRVNEAEVSGQDETLIGGAGTTTLGTTLASAMVGGSTLIAGTGLTEVLYTRNGVTANLATGIVTSLDSANDTLVGAFGEGGLSGANSVMIGGRATETFIGSGTHNTFIGGSGNTTFVGDLGGNTMIAGTGICAVEYKLADTVINLATDTATGIQGGSTASATGADTLVGVFTHAIAQGFDSTVTGSLKGGDFLEVQGSGSTIVSSGMNNVLDDFQTGSATLASAAVGNNTLIGSINPNAATNAQGLGGTVADYTGANITVNLGTQRATAAGATDTLTGITIAKADGAHDILIGPGTLIGGMNSDTLSGGLAEYVAAGVTVNLGTQTATNAAHTASDTLIGITRALITGANDVLIGASTGGDTLIGSTSDNGTLIGGVHGNTLEDGLAYYSDSNLNISFTLSPADDFIGTVTAAASGPADKLVNITSMELTGNDDIVTAPGMSAVYADGFGDTLIGSGSYRSNFVSDAAGNTLIAVAGTQLLDERATYDGNGVAVDLAAGSATVQGASVADKLIGIVSADVEGDHDTIAAGSVANAELSSGGSNNTLIAGTGGGDKIEDYGRGYDFFDVGTGDGAVTIDNGYYTATGATAPTDELDFGSGISDSNLWFFRSGYDLVVDVMGANTSVDLIGWFGDSYNSPGDPLAKITAGGLAITNQVSQLVQAMATYAADTPGFNPATATHMPTDTAVRSAIAAAWHA